MSYDLAFPFFGLFFDFSITACSGLKFKFLFLSSFITPVYSRSLLTYPCILAHIHGLLLVLVCFACLSLLPIFVHFSRGIQLGNGHLHSGAL